MITIILAGGLGTRISNETVNKPKPLILLRNKPIISYLINYYRKNKVNKFIISGGYKYNKIINYFNRLNDNCLFFDSNSSKKTNKNIYNKFLKSKKKNKYFVKVVNTGLYSQTGGRIFFLRELMKEYKFFFVTYGDGLSNVNLNKSLRTFNSACCAVLVTAVKLTPRFGSIKFEGKKVAFVFHLI